MWSKLQALILWGGFNLCLPIEQKFTKMSFVVLGISSKPARPGFASGLGWLLRYTVSIPERTVVGVPGSWYPRDTQPNLWLDKHKIRLCDIRASLCQGTIVASNGQDQVCMRQSRYSLSAWAWEIFSNRAD